MRDRIDAIVGVLRKKILESAVRGELVPQDPKDEPASVLVERLAKERLAKQTEKRKATAVSSRIERRSDGIFEIFTDGAEKDITDEIPFDIPESWEWIRLVSLGKIVGGGTPSTSNSSFWNGNIPWITPADMKSLTGKYISHGSKNLTDKGVKHSSTQELPPGSVVFSSRAPIGYVAIANNILYTNQGFKSIVFSLSGLEDCVYHFLVALRDEIGNRASGTTFAEVSGTEFGKVLFPLPPLAEQKRIVRALESRLHQLDTLRAMHQRIQRVLRDTPTSLRQQLLQAAITGKLVAQDPKDEPASVLLERIAKEREEKSPGKQISSRIVRRNNGTFELFADEAEKDITDEIPFDIPDSWEWVRLGTFCLFGGVPSVSLEDCEPNSWVLDLEDIEAQTGRILQRATIAQRKSKSSKYKFSEGMLLYSKLRPYLNKVVVAKEEGYCTTEIVPITLFGDASPDLLKAIMTSPYYFRQINNLSYGVKMPRVNAEQINSLLLPIPPLAEQKRIVAHLEKLLAQLERLE